MATISDIAKIAGVSVATVSHVVNNTRYVSPELRSKVEKAINDADTPPNFVVRKRNAKKLYNSTSNIILFLVSDLQNPFYIELERNLNEMFNDNGYIVMTFNISDDEHLAIVEQVISQGLSVSGMIISVDIPSRTLCSFLKKSNIPKVIIGNNIDDLHTDHVISDNYEGAYKATVHLIRSGHENIAMLCGDSSFQSNKDRLAGYQKCLNDNSIISPKKYIITDLQSYDDVSRTLNKLNNSKDTPSAIFVANYKVLIWVLKYIKSYNVKCPEDISVISFNDYPIEQLLTPPVTTISQDMNLISNNAKSLLLKQIEAKKSNTLSNRLTPSIITVPTKLCVRESTCGIGRGPFGEKAAGINELHLTEKETSICRKGNFKIAISFHYSGKAWMRLQEQGIRDILNALNISIIAITDANFDPDLQNKQLKSIMMLEPDALISIPTDNKATSAIYKKIAQTNTKMIFISNIPNGIEKGEYSTCVSVNERSHGRSIGRGLGDYLTHINKTKIGMLKYRDDFYTTNQRDLAAEQIITEEYPNLEICATETFYTEEDAYEATKRLIKNNKAINGIYVSWEGPAQYVMNALTDINRSDIAISTGDLEYDIALSMAKNSFVKAVSAQCPYEQGKAIAMSVANVLIGKKIPSYIGIEPMYVDRNNLCRAWNTIYKEDIPEQIKEYL